jgi:TRAP transporter TAXI family solute receptor
MAMTLTIGTNETGGTFHAQGMTLGAMLDSETDLGPVEIVSIVSASVGNARRLHAGELDLGFSAANWVGKAMRGESPFEAPIALRMVAPANVGPMFFVAPADSDMKTVDDLRGRKVAIGVPDAGMVQHIHMIFGALGIGIDEFEPVYLGFESGAEALIAGEVDAQWQCPIPNKVMTDLADRTDVRVLDYAPGRLETVLSDIAFYRAAVMPAGAFRGLDRDARQVGVLNVIVSHERASDAMIEKVVTAMIDNVEGLGGSLPLYQGLGGLFEELKERGREALEPGGVPLHPGAIAAYRKAGLLD